MENIEIIVTKDGSHSLLHKGLDETYHSRHGARQESMHVFIENGLNFLIRESGKLEIIKILEVGFGTGLNAWLTLMRVMGTDVQVHYTTLEAYPLENDIWSNLNYDADAKSSGYFHQLHKAPWSVDVKIVTNFTMHKLHQTLQESALENETFNVVYFDAFAPGKQPSMWELEILQKVVQSMAGNSVFVTYCAKGQLKRDLRFLGLLVESLPGPPGKKEMVRALRK